MSVVLLVSLALGLLLAWLVAISLAAAASVFSLRQRLNARASTRLRALVVALPCIVGLVGLVVVLLPSPLSHCHCVGHGGQHPHLCVRHPWLALPLFGFAAPIAGTWLAFAALRVWSVLRDVIRGERLAKQLRVFPARLVDGVAVRLVDGLGLGAFTIGLWRPVVVVDRSLWRGLAPVERLAVLHHEHAHASRGDALTQAFLRVLSAALPWSARAAWLCAWRSATEVACDRHAALQVRDATSVAKALVSVERLRAGARAEGALAPALAVAAGGELGPRVRALLEDPPLAPPPLTSDLRPIGLGLVALAMLLALWPGAFLHHAAESLLGLLPHH